MYTNDRPKRARISSTILLYSFAIITSPSATLADGWSGSGGYQSVPSNRHSEGYPQPETYRPPRLQNGNPWALPEQAEPEYGHFPEKPARHGRARDNVPVNEGQAGAYDKQPYADWATSHDRFVTPEFLESLKSQQSRMQQTNDPDQYSGRHYRYDGYQGVRPGMRSPSRYTPYTGAPYPPYTGSPYPVPYGMGGYNPLFDSPMSSPWLTDPGAMFRGQSFSYVPDEAIGGIPPMRTPMYGPGRMPSGLSDGMMSDSLQDSAGDFFDEAPDKVFNPFTFLPDSNLNN